MKFQAASLSLALVLMAYFAVAFFDFQLRTTDTKATFLRSKSVEEKYQIDQSSQIPEVKSDDVIYNSRTAFVIPEYKLIFFTFPKVASSEWKRMFMRMNGNPKWCNIREDFNVHGRIQNKIQILHDFEPEVATAMMTSPVWTKAAIFREPKERVLSAFLDKSVKTDHFVRNCCNKLPSNDLQHQCIDGQKSFESFLHFVTEYPEECFNIHWEPQILKVDSKWWDYIDFIGYQHNLRHDSKQILSQLISTRDESGQSAWERYGMTGWGTSDKCEDRNHSFLEENSSIHNIDTGNKLRQWYTPETEKIVEKEWAIEWTIDQIKFPIVKLFDD
jgi:hypothetical protein